jgi:hypothetical protein
MIYYHLRYGLFYSQVACLGSDSLLTPLNSELQKVNMLPTNLVLSSGTVFCLSVPICPYVLPFKFIFLFIFLLFPSYLTFSPLFSSPFSYFPTNNRLILPNGGGGAYHRKTSRKQSFLAFRSRLLTNNNSGYIMQQHTILNLKHFCRIFLPI